MNGTNTKKDADETSNTKAGLMSTTVVANMFACLAKCLADAPRLVSNGRSRTHARNDPSCECDYSLYRACIITDMYTHIHCKNELAHEIACDR